MSISNQPIHVAHARDPSRQQQTQRRAGREHLRPCPALRCDLLRTTKFVFVFLFRNLPTSLITHCFQSSRLSYRTSLGPRESPRPPRYQDQLFSAANSKIKVA